MREIDVGGLPHNTPFLQKRSGRIRRLEGHLRQARTVIIDGSNRLLVAIGVDIGDIARGVRERLAEGRKGGLDALIPDIIIILSPCENGYVPAEIFIVASGPYFKSKRGAIRPDR